MLRKMNLIPCDYMLRLVFLLILYVLEITLDSAVVDFGCKIAPDYRAESGAGSLSFNFIRPYN